MKITFNHLGVLEHAELEVKPLTIFCGPNNSGKTYLMYALYGLLDKDFNVHFSFVNDLIKQAKEKGVYHFSVEELLKDKIDSIISTIEKAFVDQLPNLFSTAKNTFAKTSVTLSDIDIDQLIQAVQKSGWNHSISLANKTMLYELSKAKGADKIILTLLDNDAPTTMLEQALSNTLSRYLLPELVCTAFLLPAERTGLNLFFRELNSRRTALLHHLGKDFINPMEVFKDIVVSRYPEPLADYIDYLNQLVDLKKHKGHYHSFAIELQKEVLNGSFQINKNLDIIFKPYRAKGTALSLHLSSSTAKTFFGLWSYLEYVAQPNQCLMIDEPELNLHPDNQRKLARILARLANNGLTVIISTHSDYLLREVNNLIMLDSDLEPLIEMRKKYGYTENDRISTKKVAAYLVDNKSVKPMEIKADEGIIAETFDEVINKLNQSSDAIYYARQDAAWSQSEQS